MSSNGNRGDGLIVTTAKSKAKRTTFGWVIGVLLSVPALIVLAVVLSGFVIAVELAPSGAANGVTGNGSNCLPGGSSVVSPAPVDINAAGITLNGQPLTNDQLTIAETIVGVGLNSQIVDPSITVQDIETVLTIGIQESQLTNLSSGDADSLGVFQQRTSQGWGTPAQIMDVTYATNSEFQHLETISDRANKSMLEVALEIQKPDASAYESTSNNFVGWEPVATELMAAVGQPSNATPNVVPVQTNSQPICSSNTDSNDFQSVDGSGLVAGGTSDPAACLSGGVASDPMVETAILNACSVLGTPYVWGGESEIGGFDCSGLVWWAFSQAGFPVGQRTTAAGEYDWPTNQQLGIRVPVGAFQRGDLIFWANSSEGIHHVAIYLGDGMIVAAPQTGEVVQVEPIFNAGEIIGGVRL